MKKILIFIFVLFYFQSFSQSIGNLGNTTTYESTDLLIIDQTDATRNIKALDLFGDVNVYDSLKVEGESRFDDTVRIIKPMYISGNLFNGTGVGSAAAGNTGEIQFNTSNIFDAESSFFWDKTNNYLGLGTNSPQATLHINGGTGSLGTGLIIGNSTSGIYMPINNEFSLTLGSLDVLNITQDTVFIDSTVKINSSLQILDSLQIDEYTIRFNKQEGVHEFRTAKGDVIWQGALEDLAQVYNNTGETILDGTPVYYSGFVGDTIPTIGIASSAVKESSDRYAGIATVDILNNDWGYVTTRGYVRGINTSGFADTSNIVYLGDSILIDSMPPYPNRIVVAGVLIGTDNDSGIVYSHPSQAFHRQLVTKSYNFTTQGIGAGTYFIAGFYEAPLTDANLTQASLTQTYGTANVAYSAHPFIVCGGAGTVNAGTIGVRVTGTSINDAGTLIIGDADTLITDITAVATDEYYEVKKFVGIVTYELIVTSGSPTTYSFDFNYGYAKYEDFGNRDFYIIAIETVGFAAANDASFNIELLYHKNTGWTYSTTAFIAGNNEIASMETDLNPYDNLSNGEPFAWKRTGLSQFIEGSSSDGVMFRITTSANNSVQSMDLHLGVVLDD